MSETVYTLAELARQLDLKCVGDQSLRIFGLATLARAGEGELSFLANSKYQKDLLSSSAAAVIVRPEMVDACSGAALVSENPYLSFAKATQLFKVQLNQSSGVHASAVVADTVQLGDNVTIAANVVVGEGVVIGDNTVIGPGCVIGDHSAIGANGLLHANVSVYHGVSIGHSVVLHSGSVIGSDGFGFAPNQGSWQKIEQLGGVTIGDQVEIGANTAIDRGALDNTCIGNNVIIDNLVQIAHNVVIGDGTAIAGCTAVAGSANIGKHCTIAGGVGIVGHISLVDGTHITAHTLVTKSITERGSYSSGTPMQETKQWHKSAVRFSQLNKMAKNLSGLLKRTNSKE